MTEERKIKKMKMNASEVAVGHKDKQDNEDRNTKKKPNDQ
jgi:hypothetical protein